MKAEISAFFFSVLRVDESIWGKEEREGKGVEREERGEERAIS